jgi:hypothetical protein
LDEEKSKHVDFRSTKCPWPNIFAHDVQVGKNAQPSLKHVIDWLDGLIGPSGLVLLVSYLWWYCTSFSCMGEVGKK